MAAVIALFGLGILVFRLEIDDKHALRHAHLDRGEPDPRRVTPMVSEENFGVVDIDWAKRQVTFDLLSDKGVTFEKRTARF